MLKERLIDRSPGDDLTTDRSRCLRMRFNRISCSLCLEHCRTGAITIDEDVRVKPGRCSACMLCVSACPSDCFEIKGLDFHSLIVRLRNLPADVLSPVLGCNKSTTATCHVKTPCLGFLSEEHLMALSAFLQKPLQIDASGCTACANGLVVEVLEKRISGAGARTSMRITEKVKLVREASALDFREIPCDRRGFFRVLRNSAIARASAFFENDDAGEVPRPYSVKRLPFKRELLNSMMKTLPDNARTSLLRTSYFSMNISDACNGCLSCVAICPAGALQTGNDESGARLLFNPPACNGCGLCRDFCPHNSISLLHGCSGEAFGWHEVRDKALHAVHKAGCKDWQHNAGIA